MKKLEWTKEEFKAYVLLYAAHCNFFESKNEEKYILSTIDEKVYHKMHIEVVVDADEKKLDKIQQYISENNFSHEEREDLIREIKHVFFADGSVDVNEKNLFETLKKMIE